MNQSQNQSASSTFTRHNMHLVALLGLLQTETDSPPLSYTSASDIPILSYLKLEKGTPFAVSGDRPRIGNYR